METIDKLNSANVVAGNNIEVILEKIGLDYKMYGKKILMSCPIHQGDNKEACVLYTNLDVPNWKCYTHGCHLNTGKSLISFIKAVLQVSQKEAIEWIEKYFGELKEDNNYRFNINTNTITKRKKEIGKTIPKTEFAGMITKPAKYYLEQGYSTKTLDRYDVGIGTKKIEYMFNRVIVPVFNDEFTACVGIIGRTLFNKCILCDLYHDSKIPCPTNKKYNNFSKWKNSPGFYCNSYLYNYWFAKDSIKKSGMVILVEGQGDVWRCYEAGIHNVLGIFGNSLTEDQELILESSGAQKIITFLDPDQGGFDGAKTIEKYANNIFSFENIKYHKEPADCSYPELTQLLGKFK